MILVRVHAPPPTQRSRKMIASEARVAGVRSFRGRSPEMTSLRQSRSKERLIYQIFLQEIIHARFAIGVAILPQLRHKKIMFFAVKTGDVIALQLEPAATIGIANSDTISDCHSNRRPCDHCKCKTSSPLPVIVDQLRNRLVGLVHQLAPRVENVRDARVKGLPVIGIHVRKL